MYLQGDGYQTWSPKRMYPVGISISLSLFWELVQKTSGKYSVSDETSIFHLLRVTFFSPVTLGVDSRFSCILGRHLITKLHSQFLSKYWDKISLSYSGCFGFCEPGASLPYYLMRLERCFWPSWSATFLLCLHVASGSCVSVWWNGGGGILLPSAIQGRGRPRKLYGVSSPTFLTGPDTMGLLALPKSQNHHEK